MKKTCIIVTGMHRSGTSMMAGMLHHCGIYTGPCIQPDKYNEKGYFEDKAVSEINKKLIGDWKDPELKPIKIVHSFDNYPNLFFLKDPRFCFTFPEWKRQFPGIEFKVIFMYRPDDEVIASLEKRNGPGNWDSVFSKYDMEIASIRKFYKDDCIRFSYSDVLADPFGVLCIIEKRLVNRVHFPVWDASKILEFVDWRLKHH